MKYYQPLTEKFFFFAQGDLSYGKGTSTTFVQSVGSPLKTEVLGTTIAIRPGITYFVSKRWAVEMILGSIKYGSRDQKTGNQTTNRDGFAFNFITRGLSPGVVFTF